MSGFMITSKGKINGFKKTISNVVPLIVVFEENSVTSLNGTFLWNFRALCTHRFTGGNFEATKPFRNSLSKGFGPLWFDVILISLHIIAIIIF